MAKIDQNVNVNTVSRISAGTYFRGDISSPYDLRIDGEFEGKLYSKGRVVIGESATVKGDIVCNDVDMWGKLTGNLFVKDTLSLKKGCTVNGGLNVNKLFVEIGSIFNGTCKMITDKEYDDVVSGLDYVRLSEAQKAKEVDKK
ncbi:MAG: polymer-forming cytoskeletal protein [Bacteroidales bacterium]|nr:polymer-forming cytoskeletal protein [Bacteroidales bacterium]